MRTFTAFSTILAILGLSLSISSQSTALYDEIRLSEAIDAYGVTGEGTIVAVLDRGIDYTHPDFIKADGTTRIIHIWDLSDNTGATATNNPFGKGTFYDENDINQALTTGVLLATRDASGHGTATAGVAAGDGSGSVLGTVGIAPRADIIVIKITSEGAPAHDGQPAEAPFSEIDNSLEDAIDFIISVADNLGKPVSMIANFGSIQGPMDGSSALARMLDTKVGPSIEGKIFTCGSGDEGDVDNHAGGAFLQGSSIDLVFEKRTANVRFDMWYSEDDDVRFEIITPTASFGPYPVITTPSGAEDNLTTQFNFFNRGASAEFFGSTNQRRELLIDFFGPNGTYTIRMHGVNIQDGRFDAILNLSWIFGTSSEFTTFIEPGYTIWDLASAHHNICPNSYVLQNWTDINGQQQTSVGHQNGIGSLWTGSGIGPTQDGRIGIDISVPGNVNFGAYAPNSFFATIQANITENTNAMYGQISAVSGANPVLAGVISLMLEIDPTLTAAEVKSILQSTARSDAFTGATPNVSWGHGKLDVMAALQKVSECPQNRSLTLPHNASVEINASNLINSSASINAPNTVRYNAKNGIELEGNFQAQQMSTLEVNISDCTN